MREALKSALVLTALLLLPSIAFAQATITGTVKDTSGAVLPGVRVEAASPALIERSRSAETDGTGQYRIIDLTAGIYYNLFNTNSTVGYDGTYDYTPAAGLGPGGEWLRPTTIVQPRFVRLNVTVDF
jgi:hypothetical protein